MKHVREIFEGSEKTAGNPVNPEKKRACPRVGEVYSHIKERKRAA